LKRSGASRQVLCPHADESSTSVKGAPTARLEELEERARQRAASWRVAGFADGLDEPVRPPAGSRLLFEWLEPFRLAPLRPPPVTRRQRARWILWRCLFGADVVQLAARVKRLESYTRVVAEELTHVIGRLDVELSELRSRVGVLEDGWTSPPPRPEESAARPAR
jgi:hypothetical protein